MCVCVPLLVWSMSDVSNVRSAGVMLLTWEAQDSGERLQTWSHTGSVTASASVTDPSSSSPCPVCTHLIISSLSVCLSVALVKYDLVKNRLSWIWFRELNRLTVGCVEIILINFLFNCIYDGSVEHFHCTEKAYPIMYWFVHVCIIERFRVVCVCVWLVFQCFVEMWSFGVVVL